MTTPRTRARITAVANQKGGVGKTTTTANVGGALAATGQRVLLVDLDPQGHLTEVLKMSNLIRRYGLGSLLVGDTDRVDSDANNLVATHSDGLDVLVTAGDMLTIADRFAATRMLAKESQLARILSGLLERYDHMLIDCPPALDGLCDTALVAGDDVIVPVQTEDTTVRAWKLLHSQISTVNQAVRPDRPLRITGLVVSMLERGAGNEPKSKIAQSVLGSLRKLPYPILASVPRGVPVSEAARFGKTVEQYAPTSEHAQAFRDVAGALT